MQAFLLDDDVMGRASAVISPSSMRLVVTLAAGVAKSVAVPAGARRVMFNATGPLWVQYDEIPALPTDDILDGTAPELNPAARRIVGVTSLGLVAPAACQASLTFFR